MRLVFLAAAAVLVGAAFARPGDDAAAFDGRMSGLFARGVRGDAKALEQTAEQARQRGDGPLETAWQGAALVMQGVGSFKAGDWQAGLKTWPRGIAMLEEADAASEDPRVKSLTATMFLSSWSYEPVPARKTKLARLGTEALAAVEDTDVWKERPAAARADVMLQAAAAYGHLKQPDLATAYYESVIEVAPQSAAAKKAEAALKGEAKAAAPAVSQRFDHRVREDFFEGMFNDDREAFARAVRLCEETLESDPAHAEAMVWLGSARLHEAGLADDDVEEPKRLWQEGLSLMHRACAAAPEDVSVLIPRAATLVQVGRSADVPEHERLALLNLAVYDYERTLRLQEPYFDSLSGHAKGELLLGLGEGWLQLGNDARADGYFDRVLAADPESGQAELATLYLEDRLSEAALKNRNCAGCH